MLGPDVDNLMLVTLGTSVLMMVIVLGGSLAMYARYYRRVPANQALIVTTPAGPRVAMSGGGILVYPVINSAEVIDLSFRALTIDLKGVKTKDDVRVDVTAAFRLRVGATAEDILTVGRTVGCARAIDPTALRELFGSRCTNALTAAVRATRHADLRVELEDRALQELGSDLSGYVADGLGIESVEKVD